MQTQDAVIVLADIGGYTRFMKLNEMALVHAESIISELLASVIDHAEHPLTLNKLEGDAALFYAVADADPRAVAESALRQVNGFFHAFSARKKEISLDALCHCGACTKVEQLHIKAVVNFGGVVVRRVRQFEEITGTSVITAHRLLKNSVPLREYVLMAEAFAQVLGGAPSGGTAVTEQFREIGAVNAIYYPPGPFVAPPPARNLMRQVGMVTRAIFHMVKRRVQGWFGVAPKRVFRNLGA